MPHIAGDKIASSHSTVIEAAEGLIRQLTRVSEVSKVVLGPIENEGNSGGRNNTRVKIIDEDTCVLLAISGSGAHQDIRVMLENLKRDRNILKKFIQKYANKRDWQVDSLDRR